MSEIIEHTPSAPIAVPQEFMSVAEKMKMAEMLAKSTIVPVQYQNRPENTFIAIDMAERMNASPMVIMQNLHIIQGKPSLSGSAMGALLRGCGLFRNVELNYVGEEGKDNWGAYVSAVRKSNGKVLKGATVTIAIAKKEGWYNKSGSKWQTIPELMLGYRAYSWFGRAYAPEIMLGMHSDDEVEDYVEVEDNEPLNPYVE